MDLLLRKELLPFNQDPLGRNKFSRNLRRLFLQLNESEAGETSLLSEVSPHDGGGKRPFETRGGSRSLDLEPPDFLGSSYWGDFLKGNPAASGS